MSLSIIFMIGMSVIQYVWICFQYVSLISKDNKYIPYMVSKSIFICKLFSPKFTIYNIWFVIYVYVYAYTHTHTHTHTPRSKAKKPHQESRRGKILFRTILHTRQRCSESLNIPCAHQDPETPQRLRQNCVWVSPEEVLVNSGWLLGQGFWVRRPAYGISPLRGDQQ